MAAPTLPAVPEPTDDPATTIDRLLGEAVREAARLLEADGAMVYLVDPATGKLRFSHDAGISSARARAWVSSIQLDPGQGMFGTAVAQRAVVLTSDYRNDPSFEHAADPDRVVDDMGIRSMVVAPLAIGDEVFGALGAFATRTDAFSAAQIALVRSLADHAAAAMANARLIAELDTSRVALAERAEIERTLREISMRISAASDLAEVLQRAVDEAARLLRADGARIDLIDPTSGLLRWAYASGDLQPNDDVWPPDPDETLDQGVSGQAVITGRPFWTGDYAHDDRFPRGRSATQYVEGQGIRSVMAVPLVGESGAFGALTAFTERAEAWDHTVAPLLEAIAAQAAIAITRTRLIDELDRSRTAQARRAEAEQALREIAARITALRDPTEILQQVIELASRLVRGEGAILDLVDPETGDLRWAFDDGLSRMFSAEERAQLWISVGVGATGQAVAEARTVIAADDLASLFPPSPESTAFYERTGFRSMIAAPITGDDGPLGVIEVYAVRPDAFTSSDAALIEALASQAAIAITNARLIAELASSREALGRTAEAERALREIAAEVSAMRDQDAILQAVVNAATRVLRADGAMIDLADGVEMRGSWTSRQTDDDSRDARLLDDIVLEVDKGVAGRALQERRPVSTGDYLADGRFLHSDDRDAFVRGSGITSVVAAPLLQRGEVLGAVTVYSARRDAFGEADAALLMGLADQAAAAIANVRLITELERSREETARRADAERTLREIAARVSAILDPTEVLERIVAEAARLLASDGARIDLWDEQLGALRWAFASGEAMQDVPDWGKSGGLKPRQAVAGLAYAEQRPVMTEDFLADERFDKTPDIEAFVRRAGIRAVVSTPLAGEQGPLGVLSVVSREPGAYSDADMEILVGLATHASIALTNANLMQQLARSRGDIERRADAERTLREIAARITAIRDLGDLLQRIADESLRLLRADGAVIHEFDHERDALVAIYDAGISDEERIAVRASVMPIGLGMVGTAVAERRVLAAGDYLTGDFPHVPGADALARETGVGSMIVAPIVADEGPLGAIEVYRHDRDAFDAIDEATMGGLAEQAAIAITNARLIAELERSQADLARRAETERTLRDITARIAALHDPDELIERVIDEARRLLGTDGAHLTRMHESGAFLVPVVVAGEADDLTRDWLLTLEFPLGGGINGLAAQLGTPVWTGDYLEDARIPREDEDLDVAGRLGVRGMAAAPLRAPGGEVIGTLAVSSGEPRTFGPDDLDLLQGLADQAAIAITNSNLLARLTNEEARFRGLVQTTPDVIWRADLEGRFTFMADSGEMLFGYPIEELIGEHFAMLTDPSGMASASAHYAAAGLDPDMIQRVPLILVRKDGSTFAAEVSVAGVFEDGRWTGNQGTVRDVSERARLERDLRRSEERYRYLVQNAPDLVWSIDADARLTFLSDATERLTGFAPDELLGEHFGAIVHESSTDVAQIDWTQAMRGPTQELRGRINLRHRDGGPVPAEFIAVATLDTEGRFAGANGSVRDMRERDRLEQELRTSEERYRFLVDNSPDIVFAVGDDGRFTYMSESVRRALGREPGELIGETFGAVIHYDDPGTQGRLFDSMRADPTLEVVTRMLLKHADGRLVPFEVSAVGARVDGAFIGIHGAARDIGDRERLERDLRESESRYRTLASSSPDLVFATDGDGIYTFLSDRAETILGWSIEEAVGQPFMRYVAPGWEATAARSYAEVAADPTVVHTARLDFLRGDGQAVPLEINIIGTMDGDRVTAIHGVARDVSERERLQRELRRQAGELASGEERAHLARELHDSVTQALFSMTLVSRSVEMLLEPDPEAARAQMGQLRELQREALAEMRALIFELRPGNIEQDGLVRALKTHAAALQGRVGLPILVESDLEARLPLEAEQVLYRVAQEALHNVVKHAAARQVRLEIRRDRSGVRLRIIDDGKGFDPTAVPDGHLGLAGMRARADRLGATFDCTSRPGAGTTIEVALAADALASIEDRARLVDDAARATPLVDSPSIRDG